MTFVPPHGCLGPPDSLASGLQADRVSGGDQRNPDHPNIRGKLNWPVIQVGCLSFAKTRTLLVSTTWKIGCNIVELGYMRSRRGILKSIDILVKDRASEAAMPPRYPTDRSHGKHSKNSGGECVSESVSK